MRLTSDSATNTTEVGHLIIEGVLLSINAIMLFVLIVKLEVSPAAVERAVTRAETAISLDVAAIKVRQEEAEKILESRGVWMEATEQRNEYNMECWAAMARAFPEVQFPRPPEIKFDRSGLK